MRLDIRNLEKSFGEKQVLKGISFTAESGKAFGLLGRNGAGKTTTIRILMDVFQADRGAVLCDGRPLDYSQVTFGYLPEERGLYPKKKITDQLIYFAELKGMCHRDAAKTINQWLDRLGMNEYRNQRLETLSKGNQQKIQLITALAHNPDVIILDEPFSGLDPVNAMLLKDVVKEEIERGKVVLFSSHQMNYIEEFCDSIAILNDGHAALTGELREIKRNYPRTRLVIRSREKERIRKTYYESTSDADEEDTLYFHLHEPSEKQRVMRELTEAFDMDEIKVFEPSLNDIFVEYAGDKTEVEEHETE